MARLPRIPGPLFVLGGGALLIWYINKQGGLSLGLPSLTSPTIGGDAQQAVDLAKSHVASEQGIDPSTIQLVQVQQIQTDQSLGCNLWHYVYNENASQNTTAWKVNLKSGVHFWDVRVRGDYQVVFTCTWG